MAKSNDSFAWSCSLPLRDIRFMARGDMGPWRHCCISGDNEATRNRMRLHCHSDNHAMTVTGKLVIQIFTVRYSRVKDKGIFTPNLRNLGNIPLCRAISTGGFGGVASDFREKVSGAHLNQ